MKNSGKSTPISLREYTEKDLKGSAAAAEMDGESNGSWTMEEVESPRSVAERGGGGGGRKNMIHNQILRIIAEDSHIGEDVGEGNHFSHINVFSRPVSPLSGRPTTN